MATFASSGLPDDFNEDDFEEYNPHPYLGGYDIALTYGQPLPPSSATCYPVSNLAASSSPSSSLPPLHPSPRATTNPPPFDYGFPENYQSEPFPSPDLFRAWPFSNWEDHQAYGDTEASGGWNGWKRALDYLFGHSQGYGERRVGEDSSGIPIYANKKLGGAESVAVEVDPAPVQRLESYANPDDWSSCYSRTAYKHNFGNPVLAYNRCYSMGAFHVEIDPNESVWHHNSNYHEANEEQILHYSAFDEKDYVTAFFGSPDIAYDKHHYAEPLHDQVQLNETTWPQKSRYGDVYQESEFPTFNWSSPYNAEREGEIDFFGSSGLSYYISYPEPSNYVELEPFEPTWSQNVCQYADYPKLSWNYSSVDDQVENPSFLQDPHCHTQREYYEQAQCVHLEPNNSTWSQYSSYYDKAQREQVADLFNSNYSLADDQMEMPSILQNPYCQTQRGYYEKTQCIQLEPCKLTQYSSDYDEAYGEQVSQISDSHREENVRHLELLY